MWLEAKRLHKNPPLCRTSPPAIRFAIGILRGMIRLATSNAFHKGKRPTAIQYRDGISICKSRTGLARNVWKRRSTKSAKWNAVDTAERQLSRHVAVYLEVYVANDVRQDLHGSGRGHRHGDAFVPWLRGRCSLERSAGRCPRTAQLRPHRHDDHPDFRAHLIRNSESSRRRLRRD